MPQSPHQTRFTSECPSKSLHSIPLLHKKVRIGVNQSIISVYFHFEIFLSDEPQSNSKKVSEKKKTRREQLRKDVNRYMFTAYIDRVQNYQNILEKNFPKAVKVYRTFFDGMKDFYSDMKRFLKIARIVNSSPHGLKTLNRQEVELYMQLPRDMVKVSFAVILTSLPFVGYAVYPLIFGFPRVFLTHHFWNSQQKVEFQQYYMNCRLNYAKPVFRLLQSKLQLVKGDPQAALLDNMLGLLGSGFHPTVNHILEIKDIFSKEPFQYHSLNMNHIVSIILCNKYALLVGFTFKLINHRLQADMY